MKPAVLKPNYSLIKNITNMEKRQEVHNLIILDESGSMISIKDIIIQGFNELVQTIQGVEKQFPDQEHYVTLVSFNSFGQKILHFADPASKLKEINAKEYNPDAMTPLFDAMGFSINKLKSYLEGKTDYNVLVTILTDGQENNSKEYSQASIKALIEEMKQKQWTFTYIGTDHDVESITSSLSIDNMMAFDKNEHGIKDMFVKETKARFRFSRKINSKHDTLFNYYDEDEDE